MSPEALSYALILVQEVLQGYDNPSYRLRVVRILQSSGYRIYGLDRWFAELLPTSVLLRRIEAVIESSAPEKVGAGK